MLNETKRFNWNLNEEKQTLSFQVRQLLLGKDNLYR